jgi:membrane-associated phospholipid phosphatase
VKTIILHFSILAVLGILMPTCPATAAEVDSADKDRNIFSDALYGGETLVRDTAHILISPLRMSTRSAVQLAVILAAGGIILAYDQEIYDAVQRSADDFPLKQMVEVGEFLDPLGYGRMNVVYFGGLGVSYFANWETGTSMFGQILTSFAVYGVLKRPVEALVGRKRPYEDEGPYSFGNDDATSFFSGHTVNVFNLATIVSHTVNRSWFTWTAYFCAASVGVQRIASDAHWPSDVFLSAAFAVAVSRGVIGLYENRKVAAMPLVGSDQAGVALIMSF